jgi:hypothetical protein
MDIKVSNLGKTWIFDLDGTIVKHNGYKIDGVDSLLDGVKDFFENTISINDLVIFVTSREIEYKGITENFLKENNIRYDHIIYGAPFGERFIVNDSKPSGLVTAIAIPTIRDKFMDYNIIVDDSL